MPNYTWQLHGITFPIPPESIKWKVARKQQVDKVLKNFPFVIDTGPETFVLQITGKIWPLSAAYALKQLCKNPDQPTVIFATTDPDFDIIYSGTYALDSAESGVDGPQYVNHNGSDTVAFDYNIELIQFANKGDLQDGDSGDLELDEDGVGFGSLNGIAGNVSFGDPLLDFFFDFLLT